jgi:hypothetical protein
MSARWWGRLVYAQTGQVLRATTGRNGTVIDRRSPVRAQLATIYLDKRHLSAPLSHVSPESQYYRLLGGRVRLVILFSFSFSRHLSDYFETIHRWNTICVHIASVCTKSPSTWLFSTTPRIRERLGVTLVLPPAKIVTFEYDFSFRLFYSVACSVYCLQVQKFYCRHITI